MTWGGIYILWGITPYILFSGIGILLANGKIRPNAHIGYMPATGDLSGWYTVNAYMGRVMLLASVAALVVISALWICTPLQAGLKVLLSILGCMMVFIATFIAPTCAQQKLKDIR